ncbi:MAG TPA: PEGA domain-containing protein [Kofleriaceae bacterium]
MSTTTTAKKTKGMCIATRCTSVEQFIQMFHRFVDEESFFVSTLNTRPPGLETSFSVQLADGTPVLRGLCVVMQAWTDASNPFKTPGVRLGIKRLTANSMAVFERLLVTRSAAKPSGGTPLPIQPITTRPLAGALPPRPPSTLAVVSVPKHLKKLPPTETAPTKLPPSRVELSQPARPVSEPPERVPEPLPPEITDLTEEPTDVRQPRQAVKDIADTPPADLAPIVSPEEIAAPADLAPPPHDDSRTPGSELVLPANPLMNLTDKSLEGYVDCTLYEETGNFFPVDDPSFVDDVAPPPPPPDGTLPRQRTITPLPATPVVGDAASFADDAGQAAHSSQPSEGAEAIARQSSPSIVVPPAMPPPPMPRESVMVDPALIARGSTPAFESDHARPSRSTFDTDSLPLPSVAERPIAPHSRSSWWLLGGALGILAITTVVVVMLWPSNDGGNAAPAQKPVQEMAQLAPPTDKPTGSDIGDEPEDPVPGEGPPLVGAGPCSVVVNTTPAGSIVEIDGTKLGPSPITVAATCATHTLAISHARYKSQTKEVTLTEGKAESVEVTLQRPTHIVTVTSNPSGATILIDGRRAGTTPTKMSVLGFVTINLEFKKTGYQPTSAKLYSRYAQDRVSVRLNKW